jgi:hypothetical protein
MPSYEDFDRNVAAHLQYAASQPPVEALAILRRRFDDESWRTMPRAWLPLLLGTAQRLGDDPGVAELRGLLVTWLTANRVGTEAQQTLPDLFRSEYGVTVDEASRLAAWFVEKAGPGDASLAAEVLFIVFRRGDVQHRRALHPVCRWLVQNGSAELRRRSRVGKQVLLLGLVGAFDVPDADPSMMDSALRYVIASEEDLSGHNDLVTDPNGVLRRAVEHVLERDELSAIPSDLSRKLGTGFVELVLGTSTYPRFRLALLRTLAKGSLPWQQIATEAWKVAFCGPCPGAGLSFASAEAIDLAVDALAYHACQPEQRGRAFDGGTPENDRAWAFLVASEFARIHELSGDGVSARAQRRLYACVAATPSVTVGIAEALRVAVADYPGLAKSLLAEGPSTGTVRAALLALPDTAPRARRGSGESVDMAEVVSLLDRLLNQPWHEPIFGVDVAGALRGATRVELAHLESEHKVMVGDGMVKLHGPSLDEMLARLPMDREAKLALAAIYFVHELVHVQQGIGDKVLVGVLRSTGSETTLLHADLGADHTAARAVQVAFPKWKLDYLKDLQGRSLTAFPASTHDMSGRARKAQRLVALRLDYLARATGSIPWDMFHDGYAFADYGPAGGKILILVSGPPQSVVRAADLTSGEAALLSSSADVGLGDRLAEIDRVLAAKLTGSAG